jgi:hypothetical protein
MSRFVPTCPFDEHREGEWIFQRDATALAQPGGGRMNRQAQPELGELARTALVILAVACVAASCAPLSVTPSRVAPSPRVVSPAPRPSLAPLPVTTASASPPSSPTLSPAPPIPAPAVLKPGSEAASVTFKSRANAQKRLAKLVAKGFFGYRIERDKLRFEVEKEFSTARRAAAEVRRLARARIHAKVEFSPQPK